MEIAEKNVILPAGIKPANAPMPNDKPLLQRFLRAFTSLQNFYRAGAKVLLYTIYRMEYRGFDNVPEEGAAILIANHVSYMDGMVIDAALERPVRFVIDEHIYNTPFVHHFMSRYKAIPILPERNSVKKALEQISEALDNGELVFIFPEGTMTYTGNMMRFRFGIEWMLKNNQVPVIPIAIKGLWGSILSRKYRKSIFRWIPRSFRRKVIVVCGKPIDPENAQINHLQRVVMHLKNSISI